MVLEEAWGRARYCYNGLELWGRHISHYAHSLNPGGRIRLGDANLCIPHSGAPCGRQLDGSLSTTAQVETIRDPRFPAAFQRCDICVAHSRNLLLLL
jgi:hypothetical protein